MKNTFKKLISSLFFAFLLAGCAPTGGASGATEPVTIQSIELSDYSYGDRVMQAKRLSSDGEENVTTSAELDLANSRKNQEDDIQYVVIYKSLQEISFTIKLDNPEARSIDAIRLKCDDPDSKIQIDGEFKPLVKEDDGTRVVNWSSEDAYEKTYRIQLQSEEYLNTLAVTDIRLSGHEKFQSKEMDVKSLGRNELKIYKMEDAEFQHTFYTNTPEFYKETIVSGSSVSNLRASGAGSKIEDGYLTVTESGTCAIEYDYAFADGLVEHIKIEEDISLLELVYQQNGYPGPDDSGDRRNNLPVWASGTHSDDLESMGFYKEHPETKAKIFMFILDRNGELGYTFHEGLVFDSIDMAKNEGYENFYVKIFESYYLVNFEKSVLVLEK